MHYGRKVLKTKVAAKKELLSAFATPEGLKVPERIERVRREMVEEYARENERAWGAKEEAEGKGKGKAPAKRKFVAGLDEDGEVETSITGAAALPKRRRQPAVKASISGAVASSQRKEAGSIGAIPSDKVRTVSYYNATRSYQPTMNPPLGQLRPHDIHGHYNIVSPFLSTNTGPSDSYSDSEPMLSLQICTSLGPTHHIWISFSFGATTGIMRSIGPGTQSQSRNPPSPSHNDSSTYSFTWRGETILPNGSNQLSFGPDHTAQITFLGSERKSTAVNHDRVLKGTISGGRLGRNVEFMGTRLKDDIHIGNSGTRHPDVSDWKRKYRAINAKAQERLLAMEWGQQPQSLSFSTNTNNEPCEESDTSDPGDEYSFDADDDYKMIEDAD